MDNPCRDCSVNLEEEIKYQQIGCFKECEKWLKWRNENLRIRRKQASTMQKEAVVDA